MRRRERGHPGRFGYLAVLALLTACAVGPDYQAPAVPVPQLRQTDHGASAAPDHESFRAMTSFPHPDPLPEGEGVEVAAAFTLKPCTVDVPQQPGAERREPLWIHPKSGGQGCPASEQGESDAKNAAAEPATSWWRVFHDPLLEQLIQQAAADNLDYRQAQDRIGAARAQYNMAVAAGLPAFSGRSSVNRRRNSFGGGGVGSGGSSSPMGFGGAAGRNISNIFQAGFDAAWELDVFGGIRRSMEAAAAGAEAERDNSRAVLVSLLGDVARHYIALRLAQQQSAILRNTQAAAVELLHLTQVRSQAGLDSELVVAQAQTLLADVQAQLPEQELAAQQAIHALGVLLGQAPGALNDRLNDHGARATPDNVCRALHDRSPHPGPLTAGNPACCPSGESKSAPGGFVPKGEGEQGCHDFHDSPLTGIPTAQAEITADLPSTLLLRRPDLGAAERRLAAATAEIGVATADLYPKFNLTAFLGLQNPNLAQFTPVGKSWSMAAAASLPLFNWGRIRANIEAKEARRDELLHAYQAAVLNALRDVEDALTAQQEGRRRRQALEQAQQAADTALQLALERYQRGLTDFIEVLDAKRSLLGVQSRLADSQAQLATDLVALYKALGGGWQAWEKSTD